MRGHLSPTPAQNTRVKRCDSQHKSPAALARLYSEMAEGILLQLVDAAAQGVHLQADARVSDNGARRQNAHVLLRRALLLGTSLQQPEGQSAG